MVDVNRGTDGIVLPEEVSDSILADVQEASAVQQLATKINLPGRGVTIPVMTGEPEADWVAETANKPVSRPTFSSKDITPYTLAVIVPFSNQFKRDLPALYAECARRLPGALAKKFDRTVFGTTGAPGSNFAQLGGATAVPLSPHASDVKKSTYAGLVAAVQTVAAANGELNGWALSPQAKALLLGQVDTAGRPLLIDAIQGSASISSLLGAPVYGSRAVFEAGTPNTIGFAGDWSTAVWGTVEGVKIDFATEGSLEDGVTELAVDGVEGGTVEIPRQINLFQRNMFAVRAEIEIGFQVQSVDKFVKLTDAVRS